MFFRSLYATDGTTIESVALPIPDGLAPADLANIAEYPTRGTVGDFLFFPWEDAANSRALWRVSGATAATPEIVSTDCGDDGGDAVTVGTTLYIACNAVLDSGNPDLPWETGSELFALTGAGDADLSGRTPQIVFDFNYAGGPATYPDDSGQSLSPGYLTVVGDTLFMTGWDFADNASEIGRAHV